MKKVITYGTFDLLHHGHIRLLERAKALGDYLIVGVTSDDFDKSRGKINGQQSLMERVEAVKETGLADEIIIEEYEGQKIDDIQRYDVDVFTVGSDWKGKFDYLNEFCEVVYLDRTEGISSTKLRTEENCVKLGFVGESSVINKFFTESKFVDGIEAIGICTNSIDSMLPEIQNLPCVTNDFNVLLDNVDALYIISHPDEHYNQIKLALKRGKHILCESPVVTKLSEFKELTKIAKSNNCVIMESIKTDYSLAYSRLLLLLKSGIIGDVVSVDSVCTSLSNLNFDDNIIQKNWNSIYAWGPTAMLPIFQILGTNYKTKNIVSKFSNKTAMYDIFTKIDFIYKNAVASLKVGKGVKSEGNLVITGTKGFVYVPSPWWKTDYFEVRFEQQELNKRFFYQLEGEGIRYELVNFIKEINGRKALKIDYAVTEAIIKCMEDFKEKLIEI